MESAIAWRALALSCALAAAPLAIAQSPDAGKGELRILVGFPPGDTIDAIARIIAEKLARERGQPVLVENRPGAGGAVAMKALLTSQPDGNVMLLAGLGNVAIEAAARPEEHFEPARDLAAIGVATRFELGLAVANNLDVRDLRGFIDWAAAHSTKAAFGSPGAGSLPHFFGLLFAQSAGVEIIHVPFKGGRPLATDLVGGHVPAGVAPLSIYLELHRTGKLRLLATSGGKRSPATPDVATFSEQGYKDVEATLRFAFWAPGKTPAAVVARRNEEINKVLEMPDVQQRIRRLGQEPAASTPEELTRLMAAETAKWTPIVKAAGFAPDR
ncbi:MAG: transporter substrate-binding protein [Ramlibacter sp.]|nr:transporter substrate-binding protein [Ramlibacter sp.]